MSESYESPILIPYLTGVYLAVNAVQDVYLVVDGPNCVFYRTAQIHGNHDWQSTLVSCTGVHRVADTECTTERAAVGDDRHLISRLRQVDALQDCRMILLTSMSMVDVTGRQYDKILKDLEDELTKQVIPVPCGSLVGDWLLGYSRTLQSLARKIDLPEPPEQRDDGVAVVGYLMDRNEADHEANLAELERLLDGLSLELTSCWLGGGTVADLAGVARAGTILSFPYARRAAEILARRTGARLIECALPVGLEGTCAWLRQIGEALDRSDLAEQLIEQELTRVAPMLEWILPHSLLDKRVVVMGDPHLVEAIAAMVPEMGCRVVMRVLLTAQTSEQDGEFPDGSRLLVDPKPRRLCEALSQLKLTESLDLVITSSSGLQILANSSGLIPFVELGFPSYYTHALHDEPWLGFSGTLKLVERMANAISQATVYSRLIYR